MTVNELIEQLKNYPGDTRVLIPGYEGGYNDIFGLGTEKIVFDVNEEWYYGSHESSIMLDRNDGTDCVIVGQDR